MTKPMTEEQLNAIRKRAEMATEGPWYVYKDLAVSEVTDDTVCAIWTESDAEFISHSRQDVPDLLAEVERLSHIVKTYRVCGHLFYADQHNGHSFTDMVETKLREEAAAND